MPPTRRARRGSRASSSSSDRPSTTSTRSTATATRTTRRAPRAAAHDDLDESARVNGADRSATPDSLSDPTTPPSEDAVEEAGLTLGRQPRKRRKTEKALEADVPKAVIASPKRAVSTSPSEAPLTTSKNGGKALPVKPDDEESDLTDYEELTQAPKRRKSSTKEEMARTEVEKVEVGKKATHKPDPPAAVPTTQPKPKKTFTLEVLPSAPSSKKAAVAVQRPGPFFQPPPPSSAAVAREAAPAPLVRKPAATTEKPKKVLSQKPRRGRKKADKEHELGEQGSFEVLLYGCPYALIEAFLLSPSSSSSSRSSSPSSSSSHMPLETRSVIRCTATPNLYVSYAFSLSTTQNIGQVLVRVKDEGTKVRGPKGMDKSVILEDEQEAEERTKARWVLLLRGKEAKWVVR